MAVKDEFYFELFVTSIEYSIKTAEGLLKLVQNYNDVQQASEQIHAIEHDADEHYHGIYKVLGKAFITPIDREDVLALAQSIDDVTDAIDATAACLYMLDIKQIRPDVVPIVKLILSAANELKTALIEFKKFKKAKNLDAIIKKVSQFEERGDRLHVKAIRGLFTDTVNPVEIFKWREVYHKLEECLDRCDDVADTIDEIIIKNT